MRWAKKKEEAPTQCQISYAEDRRHGQSTLKVVCEVSIKLGFMVLFFYILVILIK